MPNIQFTISPAPGIINDLIAVIYNTNAPAAEIARLLKPQPHPAPYDFNFPNLPVGTYIVKIHESPNGVTLGTLRHDFWVNAAINSQTAYTIKTFQVGLGRGTPYFDPADGDTDYINTDLDQLEYTVFKPGYGPLDWSANITPYPGGGFSFTDTQVFAQDEIYTILISNLVNNVTNTPVVNSFPSGVEVIIADTVFTSTHYSKVLEVSAVNNCSISIASLATIPDNTVFSINTHALVSSAFLAPFHYVRLTLPGGQFVRINGRDHNIIFVGRGEEMTFVKNGSYLRLLTGGEAYRKLGQIVYTFTEPPLGSLQLVGGWYSQTDFGRIFSNYVNLLHPAELGTGVDDVAPNAANRSKWIIGATKFWVPDHGGLFHRPYDQNMNHDAQRWPGEYQADAVGPGNVETTAWTGHAYDKNSLTTDSIGFQATQGDGGEVSTDSASNTNRNSARTAEWPIISPVGQTRPRNVSINAFVLI
jgi:hypothetical protein